MKARVIRRAVAPALAGLVTLALAGGCATHAPTPTFAASTARPLRLSAGFQFRSLSPMQNDGAAAGMLGALVFSYLERTAPDGHLVPELVRAVPTRANGGISADGRTVTYRLRDDVRWQDGVPLTARDVVFTVRAILNPKNNVGSRYPYDRYSDVSAADAHTVVVRTRESDAAAVGLFFTTDSNFSILPEHLLGKEPELNDVAFNAKPIGSGPYRVAGFERGNVVHLVANPLYFRGKPPIAAIDLRYIPDANTELVQLKTGELDGVLGAGVALGRQLAALPNKRFSNVPYPGGTTVVFNVERPTVADARVRRAIVRAIDRVRLVRDAYAGVATANRASRGLFSYGDDPHAPWPTYDARAAARELDALGWRLGTGGVRRREGRDLTLDLIYANNNPSLPLMAVEVQRQLADVGIRVDLHAFQYTQFWSHATDGGPFALGKFDLAIATFFANVYPDLDWLYACRERAPRGYNEARYCNPSVDRALADAARAIDPGPRRAALVRLQRLVATDVPVLPLTQGREIDVVPHDIAGFVPNGTLPYDSVERWSRTSVAPTAR